MGMPTEDNTMTHAHDFIDKLLYFSMQYGRNWEEQKTYKTGKAKKANVGQLTYYLVLC